MPSRKAQERAMLIFRNRADARYLKEGRGISIELSATANWSSLSSKQTKAKVDAAIAKNSISLSQDAYYREDLYKVARVGGNGLKGVKTSKITNSLMSSNWVGDKTLNARIAGIDNRVQNIVVDSINKAVKENESITSLSRKLFDGFGNNEDLISIKSVKNDVNQRLNRINRAANRSGGKIDLELRGEINKFKREIDKLGGADRKLTALKQSRKNFVKAVESGDAKRITRAYNVAIAEKGRAIADRIAKTEASRANWEGSFERMRSDEDVVAFKWILNSSHAILDVCDANAEMDLGMGAGVYPLDQVPSFPAHSNCSCYSSEVFAHEVSGKSLNNTTKRTEAYLNRKSKGDQITLMGVGNQSRWAKGEISGKVAMKNYSGLHKN